MWNPNPFPYLDQTFSINSEGKETISTGTEKGMLSTGHLGGEVPSADYCKTDVLQVQKLGKKRRGKKKNKLSAILAAFVP